MCNGVLQDDDCEHLSVYTYTYRDWWETGIAPGTVCEDCGHEFTETEIRDLDTRDFAYERGDFDV